MAVSFDHPVTVIAGTNKIGKTSMLLLIACSHYNFNKYDSTKPETSMRRHTWRDVLSFTEYENSTSNYSYKLYWRVGKSLRDGEGKRLASSQAWTGLGKSSSDVKRINAQIRNREVRLIDLERLLPARSFSNSLLRKISTTQRARLNPLVEEAFAYILEIPENVEIFNIGSHINKTAFLINYGNDPYSSYNSASGEESLINILIDIYETPENSLILIDEIEAGLHPAIQRRLADIIQYVSWIHKKQFIITTHSPTLLSSFPQKSRKFIEIQEDNRYNAIANISVNTAFSKMDAKAYPLVRLYCEDDLAKFIITNLLLEISKEKLYFHRLINIVTSGPIDKVRINYEVHKEIHNQMRLKIGYCCVFDGDFKEDPNFSMYHDNPNEFSYFLYPYDKPEKFLVRSYLDIHPNSQLEAALKYDNHHTLFLKMKELGLSVDDQQALNVCWEEFKKTDDYGLLSSTFTTFILKTTAYFSGVSD